MGLIYVDFRDLNIYFIPIGFANGREYSLKRRLVDGSRFDGRKHHILHQDIDTLALRRGNSLDLISFTILMF